MLIAIKSRWASERVLYEAREDTLAQAVERAVAEGISLRGADLRVADLSGANLSDADLRGADLRAANLRAANLSRADLRGANLSRADVLDADVSDATTPHYLTAIRDDFFSILDAVPLEVDGILLAVRAGRIDGSVYSGPCACLVGTIANLRCCGIQEIPGVTPCAERPAEQFFGALRPGLDPGNNLHAAVVEGWIAIWTAQRLTEPGTPEVAL